jgi:hypothetical protein
VLDELARREGLSGLEEKAARKAIEREREDLGTVAATPSNVRPG